jgi:SAM-dependent methyltransferase
MKKGHSATFVLLATLFLFFSVMPGANAQEYEPSVGQAGKDVIWVPTPDSLIEAMLNAAKVTPDDYVMDLGSGDGRIVIAAAKRGARATGFEYNPDMVELSKRNAEKAGVSDKATFVKADIFETDFSQATVITMYLLPQLNLKLRPTILNLKPGIRVVSHAFTMGEWNADETVEQEGRTAYLWIVPARVDGTWTWPANPGTAELKLTQAFQDITGTLKLKGAEMTIREGKLEGDKIHFIGGDREYTGRVNGKTIEGTAKVNGSEEKWSAALAQTNP